MEFADKASNAENVSESVFEELKARNVKHAFIIPGDDPWMHVAVEKYMTPVVMRDERSAAFAAQIYARINGLGVCVTSHGPGMTNLVTGLAAAFLENDQVLAISSQLSTSQQIKFNHAYIPEKFLECVTKLTDQARTAGEARAKLYNLLNIMDDTPSGPGALIIPHDVSRSRPEWKTEERRMPKNTSANQGGEGCDYIVETVNACERVVCIIGSGPIKEDYVREVREFVHKTSALVLTTLQGKGVAGGYSGICVSRHNLEFILKDLSFDLCLLIGVDISEGISAPGNCKKIVSISNNESQLSLGTVYSGDVGAVAGKLIQKPSWINPAERELKPKHAVEKTASASTSFAGLICVDTGLYKHAWASFCKATEPNSVIFTNGLSSIGWSISAAIGAHFASGKPTLAIIGDGGFSMAISDLYPIMQYNLPVSIILINDGSYGMIKRLEEEKMGQPSGIVTIKQGDFRLIAEAFGFEYYDLGHGILEDITTKTRKRAIIEIKSDYSDYVFSHH